MWEYTEIVKDHLKNPRNVGKMEDADAIGEAGSLVCGDMLKLYLKINDKGIVEDAKFQTFGCGSAIASSSILTEMIIGKSLEEVRKITNQDIVNALGGLPDAKVHCSVMGHEALEDALNKYFGENANTKEDIICKCFNVTKTNLLKEINEHNLKTVEDVMAYTKAGSGCGACKEKIQEFLNEILSQKVEENDTPVQFVLKINKVIDKYISNELRKDGGDIELVDVKGKIVYVKLTGNCQVCKNAQLTLKNFVENTLREHVSPDIIVEKV